MNTRNNDRSLDLLGTHVTGQVRYSTDPAEQNRLEGRFYVGAFSSLRACALAGLDSKWAGLRGGFSRRT